MSDKLDKELVEKLRRSRTSFGAAAARVKADLLRECAGRRIADDRALRAYHDVLLFLVAYADNAAIRNAATRELERVAAAAGELVARPAAAERLLGSGIAGTTVESPFSLDLIEWLCDRFPADADLAWDDTSLGPDLDGFLASCLPTVEADGFYGSRVTVHDWLQIGRGDGAESDLAWLAKRLRSLPVRADVLDQLVGLLDLTVRLDLRAPLASRTFARAPGAKTYTHRDVRRSFDLPRLIGKPPPAPDRLSRAQGQTLIDVARGALAARSRETDPVTYANPDEVARFRLDRGIDVIVYGMQPARRLPIESFFGLLVAKNGVPVAYGGGWVFLDRSEIGINVFDAFRGGESAYLFGQAMRVYRHHFGVRTFLVDPYQIGADNPEGIRTGAFWFYYRLGFRPRDAALRAVAAEEWELIKNDRTHRTKASVLRRFARSPLAFDAEAEAQDAPLAPDLPSVALGITATLAGRSGGDRVAAEAWACRRTRRVLGAQPDKSWTNDERAAFDRLAVLVACIDDLETWPVGAKRTLVKVMRAKGSVRERDYAVALRKHARLRAALRAFETHGQAALDALDA